VRGPSLRLAVATVAVAAAAAVVVGCSSPALPPPITTTAQPATQAPGGSPAGSAGRPAQSGAPAASAPAGFSPAQAELFAALRPDAQVNCAPRTSDLPQGATDGIECTLGTDLVERVGVYRFDTPEAARSAYIARLAGYGVALRSGDCQSGTAGDRAWVGEDGEINDQPYRLGCFLDENGTANVRIVCGPPDSPEPVRYIGVLGAGTDLLALTGWAERHPESPEQPIKIAPGLCGELGTGPE
jgi:hypothetical protein